MAQVKEPATNNNSNLPKAFGDVRQLAAPLGLKEYWYPALEDRQVKKKPVGLKMLGEDLLKAWCLSGWERASQYLLMKMSHQKCLMIIR